MTSWLGRVIWVMLAVAGLWVFFQFGSAYTNCRADGTDPIPCFLAALLISAVQVAMFIFTSAIKFLSLILP